MPTGSYAFSIPTGTGPFKFKSWTVGEKVELVRTTSYWGKKAKLSRSIIRPIADNTAASAGAPDRRGQRRTTWPRRRTSATIKGNSSLKVIKRPAFNVAYVTIHQGKARR